VLRRVVKSQYKCFSSDNLANTLTVVGAAIALSALANVQVTLYEQARELREIGAGIQIGFNCWKVLELLGAADDVKGYCMIDTLYR